MSPSRVSTDIGVWQQRKAPAFAMGELASWNAFSNSSS